MGGEDVEELGGHAAGMREVARDDDERHRELLCSPVEGDGRLQVEPVVLRARLGAELGLAWLGLGLGL